MKDDNVMNIELKHFISENGKINIDVPFITGTAYINATSVYQKFGKSQQAFSWWKDNTLVPYADRLIKLDKIQKQGLLVTGENQVVTLDDVIVIKKGGRAGSESVEQGTWFHPDLGIIFARWLDMDFGIWCDEVIREVLSFGRYEMKPADEKWVMLLEDVLENCPLGGAQSMKMVRELIIKHEDEGYNIKTFQYMIDIICKGLSVESRANYFEKLRKVIKNLYEEGLLGRTSHEEMLERVTIKVVKVLKAKVRKEKRLVDKLAESLAVKEAAKIAIAESIKHTITIPELCNIQKKEHDKDVENTFITQNIINTKELDGHRIMDISITPPTEGLHRYILDADHIIMSQAQCIADMDIRGYKDIIHGFMDAISPNLDPNGRRRPDFSFEDSGTAKSISIWEYENSFGCKITKKTASVNRSSIDLAYFYLYPYAGDTRIWIGSNNTKTVLVTYDSFNHCIIAYGLKATQKV